MKKVAAFLTALILFAAAVTALHVFAVKAQPKGDRNLGYWISSGKDSSYELLAENIGPKTALYMGSSEFHHGLDHPYNPANLFRKSKLDLMCVGAALNQSLTHAITVGAVGPKLSNKKACLILSPTWFYKHRSAKAGKGFLLRYSSTCFEKAMENELLSEQTREKIKKRKEQLLGESGDKKGSDYLSEAFGKEKDRVKTALMWVATGSKTGKSGTGESVTGETCGNRQEPDFSYLKKEAEKIVSGDRFTNPYNMEDKVFRKKFEPKLEKTKGKNKKFSFKESDEYGDLQLFLDVCREQDIEVLLILQPMNGMWYDHTGFTAEKRHVVSEKISRIAEENGVELCDLTDEEYTKGFFEDAVHPSEKGWVIINEKAYNFFNS